MSVLPLRRGLSVKNMVEKPQELLQKAKKSQDVIIQLAGKLMH